MSLAGLEPAIFAPHSADFQKALRKPKPCPPSQRSGAKAQAVGLVVDVSLGRTG